MIGRRRRMTMMIIRMMMIMKIMIGMMIVRGG
jgi:hypothetical protein